MLSPPAAAATTTTTSITKINYGSLSFRIFNRMRHSVCATCMHAPLADTVADWFWLWNIEY